jgi:predicted PurR-regulated permease PerM
MAELPPSSAAATPPAETPMLRVLQGIFSLLAAGFTIALLALGRDLVVPLVLAVLLAFVLAPIVVVLRRFYVPQALGVVLAVLVAATAIGGLGLVMGRQAGLLATDLPTYQRTIAAKLESLRLGELMEEADSAMRAVRQMMGNGIASHARPTPSVEAPPVAVAAPADAATPIDVIRGLAGPVLAPLATAGIVMLFTIFVLLYREDLRDRLIRLAGSDDLHRTTVALDDAARRLSRLFLAQVALNSVMGLAIGLAIWAIGLPSPALWGILAGLMRFVPFIGSFIALMPPLLLAVAVDPGWSMAIWLLLLFLVVEPVVVQVIEPAIYGHSTGLSPVAVIVAATVWTFLWGPIGLLLATPLTVCLVVLGRHVPSLGFLDVMLGDRPALKDHEALYQRALQRDARELSRQALRHRRERRSLTAYYDGVGLPALVLADQDWSREVLSPERLEDVRGEIATLLGTLQPAPKKGAGPLPAEVLCSAGRGPLDDLAATMAVQALSSEGLGALPLAADTAPPAEAAEAWLCCLCVLEAGNSADGIRYLARRLQRQMPQARVVVGLWQAEANSPLLAELRGDPTGETIVTSLGELVALGRARPKPEAA